MTSTIKKRAVFSLLILAAVIGTAAGFLLQGFFSAAPTGMWVAPSDENNIPARIDVFVTGKTEGGRDSARTFTGQLYLPGRRFSGNVSKDELQMWISETDGK